MRHPDLLTLLDRCAPCAVHETAWRNGTVPLRISSYLGPEELPEELVTSVRVIVRVGEHVVVCDNVDGFTHAWPGGRREPGETYAETASREVREETGWVLDPCTLTPLGWLHLFHLGDPVPPFPHPDVLQLVLVGHASERVAEDWTDTEGYEISSRLAGLEEAHATISAAEPLCQPFLKALIDART